ncbi:RNA degradosome polyphosphate kinase [Oecophyllibacter saccharovorans]|uniref:RNA degradosome polyphosphate kinase n=1 Tax=Oecophyllibacter saccharovorans TaxID=2558360 RepID=UPI001168682A|nr:RNA degradosome polyphosphate kinase [Oecophyllibacter saccharovorans]TPW36750.1 RNA degradosome polyphosphate kinase [Oecophyllibacter saccharovorans]
MTHSPHPAALSAALPGKARAEEETFRSEIKEKGEKPAITATMPERFLNRELSWLDFNERVLEEARNPRHPLLERVRFLSISARNLDEFYSVRVAGLVGQVREERAGRSPDGATPAQQLEAVRLKGRALKQAQQRVWRDLRGALREEGIVLLGSRDLEKPDRDWLEEFFNDQVFPVLTPLAVDRAQPLPFVPNMGLALVLCLKNPASGDHVMDGIVLLPARIPRFIRLPGNGPERGREARFVLLEDVITLFASRLFPGLTITSAGLLRLVRDTDVEFEDEAEDLVNAYETALKQRRRGTGIHLEMESTLPVTLGREIGEDMGVSTGDLLVLPEMIGLVDLEQLVRATDRPDLLFAPYTPLFPQRVLDFDGDCFAAIRAKDMIIHHPFESFDVVVQFLRQAARDPNVVAIKQTLYRTSSDSPIVQALIEAAEAGKSVTAVVELRARFDEEANIRFSRALEAAGVQVVYGLAAYKTHAKLSLVVRREGKALRSYAHFGTGNYHPVTARIYTDLSFFTCDEKLVKDSGRLFNYVTGWARPEQMEALSYAPVTLRADLEELVRAEMRHAREGRPAHIWLKMNSLVDPQLIDLLYEASQAGVRIDGLVRGICCLRPGVPGLSENIRIRSLVGRFLEHSRIFAFGNGRRLPSRQARVYMSSADWMPRNMDRRVEVMVPLTDPVVHAQVLGQIMVADMRDTLQSWELNAQGEWHHVPTERRQFSAHEYFMAHPSLSGRGTAGAAELIAEPYAPFRHRRDLNGEED